ncbi:MAG TPA: AAA family ATPase, partial [Marinagarivorans sp.]|nr:AAA family ATPase [Marinagarivorans sp.]
GHLLIEDLPGMGKTTLAHCLAKVLGLKFERVQFTADLLPADILGVAVFAREQGVFRFHPGPIFTQVLLADEINRASTKTQSALLEAMEEGQVTVEGKTRPLPTPFFVIATQNPLSQSGTYHLPESQLDRFLMRISIGYPTAQSERMLFEGINPRQALEALQPVINREALLDLQSQVRSVTASHALLDYLQRLVAATRQEAIFSYGLSPRGALAWLNAAKAWAFIHERNYLIPEDLQAVMQAVLGHRLKGARQQDVAQLLKELQQRVPVLA